MPTWSAKHQKGFSLLEVLAVIVIVVIGMAGLYAMFGGGLAGAKGVNHAQQLTGLYVGGKSLYPSPSYTGISANQIITAGKAPSDMVNGTGAGATLSNPWGGSVTVAAANYGTGTSNAIAISSPQIPTNECNTVINTVASTFNVIKVGSTTVKDDSAGTVLSSSAVTTACAASGSNTVVFTAT